VKQLQKREGVVQALYGNGLKKLMLFDRIKIIQEITQSTYKFHFIYLSL